MKIFSVLALMLISVATFAYAQDEITPITVSVDIKPGNCINPINLNGSSENRGLFSFAIMGTTDFDVAQIDPESIRITREDVDGEVCYHLEVGNAMLTFYTEEWIEMINLLRQVFKDAEHQK